MACKDGSPAPVVATGHPNQLLCAVLPLWSPAIGAHVLIEPPTLAELAAP